MPMVAFVAISFIRNDKLNSVRHTYKNSIEKSVHNMYSIFNKLFRSLLILWFGHSSIFVVALFYVHAHYQFHINVNAIEHNLQC